ncbi:hypothetical protein [Deinococcus radiotolerans]|uniref:Uncharacterized protein n=1 Tax=Deinococcus radiotolerans TaxID=1309407 RepID=A0ABQ2FJC3_9DEIO|nr:hypothetical protein [Deinococcus radiotolerans]GGL03709.1 hypothetical protein GCM10010844_22950 [Deinococcus radiotolerans]
MRAAWFTTWGAVTLGALGLAATVTPTTVPALPAGWQAKIAALLPQVGQSVTLLERRPSISTVGLEFVVASAGGDRDVLRQVTASAARGIAPVYDKRLNITPEEFKRYLVFQNTLASTGKTFRLVVTRDPSRLTFGDNAYMNGVLKGVSIDLKTGEMRGPEGFTARPIAVPANDDPDRGLLVRSGYQWRMIGNNAQIGNGVRGTLNLLQLASGRVVLSYTRKSMIDRKVDDMERELIIEYSR